MDKELDVYYQNRFQMFATQGWLDLLEDIRNMETSHNKLNGVTAETLAYKQGELAMMQWLLSLEHVSQQAYEDLNATVQL